MIEDLGLSGNELLVYAVIYGYSQDGESFFSSSYQSLADIAGCSRRWVVQTISSLVRRGLIIKDSFTQYGVQLNSFRAVVDENGKGVLGGEESSLGGEENSPLSETPVGGIPVQMEGSEESSPLSEGPLVGGVKKVHPSVQEEKQKEKASLPLSPHTPYSSTLEKERIKEERYENTAGACACTRMRTHADIQAQRSVKAPTPVAPPPSPGRFVKPTLDEVRAYCAERRNNVDPEMWYDFYESKGWWVGSNHMKDWRAAVRTWERNNRPARYGREQSKKFGNTAPGDFKGKGSTRL